MNGIINLNKPAGMTSHDAVNFIRRLTGIKKVGHTGTLDPNATGVLPICIGKSTRLIEYMEGPEQGVEKVYGCEMLLGKTTDTMDIWGRPTEGSGPALEGFLCPPEQEIRKVIRGFVGAQTQLPPAYSAIKFQGKKLYEYARAGQEIPEQAKRPRHVYINNITVNSIDEKAARVSFDVACSRGVYIRSLCHDIGQKLGCGAVMSALIRKRSGVFDIADSHLPEALKAGQEAGKGELPLLPMDYGLSRLESLALTTSEAKGFVNGAHLKQPGAGRGAILRVYGPNADFLGIGRRAGSLLIPEKVIVT